MNKFYTFLVSAALCFLALIFSAPRADAVGSAVQGGTNFGVKSVPQLLSLCSEHTDLTTDYYFISYYRYNDLDFYNIYFFTDNPVHFIWGNEFSNNYSNGYSGSYYTLVTMSFDPSTGNSSSYSFGQNGYVWLYDLVDNGVISYYNSVDVVIDNNNDYNVDAVRNYHVDSFYVRANSFAIDWYVNTTSESRFDYNNYYYYTDSYKLLIYIPWADSLNGYISYMPASYTAHTVLKDQELVQLEGQSPQLLFDTYRLNRFASDHIREVAYCPNIPSAQSPSSVLNYPAHGENGVLDSAFYEYCTEHSSDIYDVTWDNVLDYFKEHNPGLDVGYKDLYSVWKVMFLDHSGEIAFTKEIDFSNALGHDEENPHPDVPTNKNGDPNESIDDRQQEIEDTYYFDQPGSYNMDDPDVADFDFSFDLDDGVRSGAGFIRILFDKVIGSAGLSSFLIVVLAIAVASWFIFGPMR